MTTALAILSLASLQKPAFPTITPESCLSHIRFLASDLLEGRGTPSRGLDLAAEYIASQFQSIGLAPVSEKGYLVTSDFTSRRNNVTGKVSNVVGLLRGSDPKLKDTYILVTAHYDHLGKREGEGDQIWNGANDDASGTSGVIEVARALKSLNLKRSVAFVCFWGEESGLLGSRAYVQKPSFPLKQTIANVNLEQIGRTDDDEGPRVSEFNLTGFDYSNLASFFETAAKPFGVKVTMHPKFSSPYFFASDNAAFAGAGVIAHTISTAYSFPDYHKPGDEWSKIHSANMATIVQSAAAGIRDLANSAKAPEWNRANEKAKRFYEAYDKLMGISPKT